MSSNKRKILALDISDEDDNFKHRRSSLKVNLSYSENLTDSGNGSLWKTEIENNEQEPDAAKTNRDKNTCKKNPPNLDNEHMRAVSDMNKCVLDNNSKMSVQIKEGIQLKHLTINLEDISIKEYHLETSCKHLKDLILSKTKKIFDKQNEFSIKTAMVLGNEVNHFESNINNLNIGNKSILDTTDHHLKEKAVEECKQYTDTSSNQQREDNYSNIIATPTNSNGWRKLEKTVDKSRLTQRRLFVENKRVEEQAKCRIIKDIVLKKSLPLLSLRQMGQNCSPILSGSNRRLSLLKTNSKLYAQSQFKNHNNTCSILQSSQNIDVGMPVICSTFIEDKAIDERKINNDVDISNATTNKVISMEMTEVHNGIRISEEHFLGRSSNKNTVASKLENIQHPINKVTIQNNIVYSDLSCVDKKNDQNAANVRTDTIIPMQMSIEEAVRKAHDTLQTHEYNKKAKCQDKRRHILYLSDSNNMNRSSLNVNTSLDAVIEVSKVRDSQKPSDYKTNITNRESESRIYDKELMINQHENANTIQTSLQMNTSIDSTSKTWQRGSNYLSKQSQITNDNDKNQDLNMNKKSSETENRKRNNIDFLENISLMERLRNISMRNQIFYDDKSRVSKMKNEDKRSMNSTEDNYSCIEGTPYPISRSYLFKSQLKHKTQNLDDTAICSSNLMNDEKSNKIKSVALHSKIVNKTHVSTEMQETVQVDAVILENISNCSPFVTQNQLMVIENMLDETKSETEKNTIISENMECIPVPKSKRKLLPLEENSQLCSITPIDEKRCISEEPTSVKRNKGIKKKYPKRKSIHSKNDTSNIKHNIIKKQMWSDSDRGASENKRKENKKTRQPRKVISKKIRIKKFVDENMLNILQGNEQNEEDCSIENRDSSNDFVKHYTISNQWNKHKSQKIVIVTTGLSKEDKSLVKSIVKFLGAAEVELNVSRRTTHVVSTGVRTVNLLRGIIRGCWLVTLEWILKSLENNAWLNPDMFEMKHFSKAVQENRKDRQLFGNSYIPELFTTCGFIYVEDKTTVPCDTLKELIKTAGGHITENTKFAKIIIGANGLKETWVIDSITTGELQLTKLYQRR
ncbi:hypothetical protein P5V15_003753 [Pogonomyrmex californicus]